jgi:type IV pilus assembly protein PilQ
MGARLWLMALLASCVAAPVALAQEPVMDLNMTQAGNVTIDFRDADIRNVLKVLAYKSGVNIIAGPDVVGQVNIQLKDVPWQKALDVVLSTYGYSYDKKGSVIMVATVENLKKRREDTKALAEQEAVSTEAFILNYAKAEDVLKTVDKMKSARGSVNFDQRTNAVIVTDLESSLSLIRDVVKRLDAITPQVLIEARIIETALNDQETLGLKWPTSLGGNVTFPNRPHSFPWTDKTNSYLPEAQYSLTGTTTASTSTTSGGIDMTYGIISASALSLTLDMLQSRTNTNVVSNPRIVTLDNQPAKINVGNKYPLPRYTYSDTQDKVIVSGWEYIEYGLTFNVTPHINGKGMVTLDIEPVVTDSPSSVAFQFGTTTTNVPVLSTESAKTNVMIKDGDTLVIAGLIKDKKSKTVQKVPILGSIPFLGKLFQHKTDTMIKTEMMIFLTPRIITPGMDLVQVAEPSAQSGSAAQKTDAVKVTLESVEAPRPAR